jgi:HlyD family secretion protein
MGSSKKWIGVAVLAAVIAVPVAVKLLRGEKGIEVALYKAEPQEIRPTILASGTIAYRTEVNLTSELIAKVEAIHVAEGDTVVEGQRLMSLDPETYRNAIDREEAGRRQSLVRIERQRVALDLRERQFARTKALLEARMIDTSRFDEERNQLELARVELKSSEEDLRRAEAVLKEAREQLAKTEILAPIAGKVVALPIKVGETAIPSTMSLAGAQLLKIADTSAIQAELKVDEADIAKVAIGQQADVFAAAWPERAIKGRVEKIALAPTIEAQSRAYLVTVALDAPADLALRSGMSARTDIFLSDGAKRLAVPVEAVVTEAAEQGAAKKFLWVARDGFARKVEIATGISDDRWNEVASGVAAGEPVITGPSKTVRLLKDGDRVSELPRSEATATTGRDEGDAG